jgi:hypothetical protein
LTLEEMKGCLWKNFRLRIGNIRHDWH